MKRRRAIAFLLFFLMTTAAAAPIAFKAGKANATAQKQTKAASSHFSIGKAKPWANAGHGRAVTEKDCAFLRHEGSFSRIGAEIDCLTRGSGKRRLEVKTAANSIKGMKTQHAGLEDAVIRAIAGGAQDPNATPYASPNEVVPAAPFAASSAATSTAVGTGGAGRQKHGTGVGNHVGLPDIIISDVFRAPGLSAGGTAGGDDGGSPPNIMEPDPFTPPSGGGGSGPGITGPGPQAIPVPSALPLLLTGLGGIWLASRRRKRS